MKVATVHLLEDGSIEIDTERKDLLQQIACVAQVMNLSWKQSQRLIDFNLSKRELQVLMHLLVGASNKEIARDLKISPRTVEIHIQKIYDKVGIRGRVNIIAVLGDEKIREMFINEKMR